MRPPRILFVGPMLGRHAGWVPNPAEILAPKFAGEGYTCILTSDTLNRYFRLVNIVQTMLRERKHYDIVSIQVYSGLSFLVEDIASLVAGYLGKKIVMVLHGGNMPVFMQRFPDWSRRVLVRAHTIVTPSAYLQSVVSLYGFGAEVIPNMLDLEKYPFRLRRIVMPRLLWMRTFFEYCHPELAVEVLERLSKFYEDASLTMSGQDKGLLETTKQLVEKKGLQSKVRFAGFLNEKAKQREFGNHDIYLNTNRIDNMPIAVIEAGAFGLPVVAMSVGGIPFLLKHEQTALLTPFGDVDAMVAAISRLVEEPAMSTRISRQGRKLAEKSAWENVFPLWDAMYKQVYEGGI
jgi:glycosyltransferase involved in cell wall biosynthesis